MIDEEVSLGDYVIAGGEAAALVAWLISDAVPGETAVLARTSHLLGEVARVRDRLYPSAAAIGLKKWRPPVVFSICSNSCS